MKNATLIVPLLLCLLFPFLLRAQEVNYGVLNICGTVDLRKSVQLNWQAGTERSFSHFVIERSRNDAGYKEMGRIAGNAPNQFTDDQTVTGDNYYRILQIDWEGRIIAEGKVKIRVHPSFSILFYPQPVRDQMTIDLSTTTPDEIGMQISNEEGMMVSVEHRSVHAGNNQLNIQVQDLAAGIYELKIFNSKNQTMDTMKVVKL